MDPKEVKDLMSQVVDEKVSTVKEELETVKTSAEESIAKTAEELVAIREEMTAGIAEAKAVTDKAQMFADKDYVKAGYFKMGDKHVKNKSFLKMVVGVSEPSRKHLATGLKGFTAEEFYNFQADRQKALSEGSDSAGGFLVPEEWEAQIIAAQSKDDMLSGRVTTMITNTDVVHVNNESVSPALGWIGEEGSISAGSTDPSFKQTNITNYKRAALWALSSELLADNISNVDSFLIARAGQVFASDTEDYIIGGSGSSQPYGINAVNLPSTQIEAIGATPTFEDFINMKYLMPRQYRRNMIWLMPTAVVQKVVALKDGNSRPIFLEGLQGPNADRLLGYPIVENDNVDDNGTDCYLVDPTYYFKSIRAGIRVDTSKDYYFNTDQIGIRMIARWGGSYIGTNGIVKGNGAS